MFSWGGFVSRFVCVFSALLLGFSSCLTSPVVSADTNCRTLPDGTRVCVTPPNHNGGGGKPGGNNNNGGKPNSNAQGNTTSDQGEQTSGGNTSPAQTNPNAGQQAPGTEDYLQQAHAGLPPVQDGTVPKNMGMDPIKQAPQQMQSPEIKQGNTAAENLWNNNPKNPMNQQNQGQTTQPETSQESSPTNGVGDRGFSDNRQEVKGIQQPEKKPGEHKQNIEHKDLQEGWCPGGHVDGPDSACRNPLNVFKNKNNDSNKNSEDAKPKEEHTNQDSKGRKKKSIPARQYPNGRNNVTTNNKYAPGSHYVPKATNPPRLPSY